MNEPLLNSAQVMRRLHIGRSTLAGLREVGALHAVRLPTGGLRYHAHEVERIVLGDACHVAKHEREHEHEEMTA